MNLCSLQDKAIESYEECLRLNPKYLKALMNLH